MSILNEAVIKTKIQNLSKVKQQAKPDDTIEVVDEKKGKDIDGDGDVDSDDYLAARDAAIKKAKARKKTNEAISSDKFKKIPVGAEVTTQGITSTVKDNDGYRLELSNGMTVNYAQFNLSGIVREDRSEKIASFIRKAGGAQYKTPFTDFVKGLNDFILDKGKDNSELQKFAKKVANIEKMKQKEFNAFIKELGKSGYNKNEIERLKKRYKKAMEANNKKPVNEAKTVELPTDTTFILDLKHLMQKHMDQGKSEEDTLKLTKTLMKKLHDKGEVTVDGTKVMFKEGKKKKSGYMGYTELAETDTQLALPEPDAPNYLGDDGMDYEGGMAKSQMLKMKNYAKALCDMIDDETQLEAWVQAKLTKASDYMSSVYHYLDYQQTKNLNEASNMMDTDEALVSILMGEANLSEETAEQVVDGLSNEDFKKAALMMVRGTDERVIAKFILSATKLDESSKINENRLVPKDEWEQLDIEWEMPNPDENRLDYQAGALIGTTDDGREFESYGYYTEFEGLVIDDDVYEV